MAHPSRDDVLRILPDASSIEEIKIGGQKAVFKASEPRYGTVVVKIMLPDGSIERLAREIEIVVENNLVNVPRILGQGTIDVGGKQALYILEEFIDGGDFRSYLMINGELPVAEVIRLMGCLLETVVQLEACGVVHRDIKPENIIRDTSGNYWLLDFGIARYLGKVSLTATAAHFGPHTAGYAAPEQFRNLKKTIDSKADLFSIGIVAYEAATGLHPFAAGARDPLELLRRTEMMVVRPLIIAGDDNGELSSFVMVMMDKFSSRRPPSARAAKSWFDEIVNRFF